MSYDFDAVNDYLYTSTLPVSAYGFTVSMWVKRHNFGDVNNCGFAMGVNNAANPQFSLRFDPSGTPFIVAVSDDGLVTRNEYVDGDPNVTQNGWSHVAGVWASNSSRTIYLAGTGTTDSTLCAATFTSMNQMRLGVNMQTALDFDGQIAHVAIWNTALTAQNIADLAAGDNPLTIAPGNLVAYWPLTSGLTDVVGTNTLSVANNAYLVTPADDPPVDAPPTGVTISNASDEVFETGESITITGSNFGASQGAGVVKISPTDNVNDASAVSQTVTAWSDTSITITVVRGSLAFLTGMYLFVKNNAAASNATGYSVQIEPKVYVRETLVDLAGNPVANQTGLRALIWRSEPTAGLPNPNQVIDSLTTNGSGVTAWQITRGTMAVNDPIWLAILKSGTPYKATLRKITPSYE